jgi:hypothetical protein
MFHLLLHFLVPIVVALVFYRREWPTAFVLMMLGMLIDFDHLLADPIYDPGRCSIGLHPLHMLVPIGIYVALFAHERTRLVGLGLCIHIALDAIDCQMTGGVWIHGY